MDGNAKLIARPFLLMEGGPLFNLQKRIGFRRGIAPFLKRRALLAALITWVPLLILSQLQGLAFGHTVPVPFLFDFSGYTRFLLAIPLLFLAENVLGPRIAGVAAHFITSGIILENGYRQFDNFIELGLRSRDSAIAEVIIAILAYTSSTIVFSAIPNHVSTWYRTISDGDASLIWAGYWLLANGSLHASFWVPLPTVALEDLSLVSVSRQGRRLDMQLFPTHPDEAGGLGFVGEAQRFFGIVLFAFSLASNGKGRLTKSDKIS